MFHKILVAIDRSELSQHIFEEALTLSKALSASLILLNVLSSEDEVLNPSMLNGYESYLNGMSRNVGKIYRELWQSYAEQELKILQSRCDEAIAAGVDATFRQGFGSPGRVICEAARELDVNLIVLGRHGRSGFNELVLGSVSNYVLHHAPCSVLTVQTQIQSDSGRSQEKAAMVSS